MNASHQVLLANAAGMPYSPSILFGGSEQGAWYDPSDVSTMFQDAAGTTPVTNVEQPVGLLQDKSGRGNHASQTTLAARPVLSAKYNLLTYTEQFDNVVWGKFDSSITTGYADPLGGTTANKLQVTTASAPHALVYSVKFATPISYTISVCAKAGEYTWCLLANTQTGGMYVNLATGALGTVNAGFTNASVTSLGSGWYRLSITFTGGTNRTFGIYPATGDGVVTFAGSNSTDGIYVWGADLRVANDGVGLPSYQRVTTSTDYDATGFVPYLRFDGVDDCLFTSTIDFTSTDAMTVWAGERKLSDAAQGVIAELSGTIASNDGTFLLSAPNSAAANLNYSSKGTVLANNTVTTYTAPITNVITGQSDISADSNVIRVNGAVAATVSTDQGTGNFGNYAMYVGRRNNASLQFNGRIYSLIVRGAASTEAQVIKTENWINNKLIDSSLSSFDAGFDSGFGA